METRKFEVDPQMRGKAREVFSCRVRLKFQEQGSWGGLGLVKFTVTGPADVIEDAAKELDAATDEWWQRIQV